VDGESVLRSDPLAVIALRDSVEINGDLRLVDGFIIAGYLGDYVFIRVSGSRGREKVNQAYANHPWERPFKH
jgi:hypothetical protein